MKQLLFRIFTKNVQCGHFNICRAGQNYQTNQVYQEICYLIYISYFIMTYFYILCAELYLRRLAYFGDYKTGFCPTNTSRAVLTPDDADNSASHNFIYVVPFKTNMLSKQSWHKSKG